MGKDAEVVLATSLLLRYDANPKMHLLLKKGIRKNEKEFRAGFGGLKGLEQAWGRTLLAKTTAQFTHCLWSPNQQWHILQAMHEINKRQRGQGGELFIAGGFAAKYGVGVRWPDFRECRLDTHLDQSDPPSLTRFRV